MSINQAIADGVDVINYSIGSAAPSAAWDDFDTVGFLNARAAGHLRRHLERQRRTRRCNDRLSRLTPRGSPPSARRATAATTATSLIELVSSEGPLADLVGKSITSAPTAAPIVYAGDFGDPLCLGTTGNEANFTGSIVICDRGGGGPGPEVRSTSPARAQLVSCSSTTQPNFNSLLSDSYVIPGVFLGYADGVALKEWLDQWHRSHGPDCRDTRSRTTTPTPTS